MNDDDIKSALSLPEQKQIAEIIQIQRQLSIDTSSEQALTLIFRNGHILFINATNNRKAAGPHIQHAWKDGLER